MQVNLITEYTIYHITDFPLSKLSVKQSLVTIDTIKILDLDEKYICELVEILKTHCIRAVA